MTRNTTGNFRAASCKSPYVSATERPPIASKPLVAAVALALLALNGAHAAPTGGQVVGGAATIQKPNANTTLIQQSTQRAALNWTSFGIAANESVIFQQPSASSVALNRVVGSDPSLIYGSLQANGQIFLVNPSGILFARGASVDVGGLVASTLGISNPDFMAGRYVFSGERGAGAVVNHANIRAANGGYVAFLGSQVANTGKIVAERGTVAFAAGDTMQLDFHGDGLLTLKVDAAGANAKVEHGGIIHADGGQVFMTVRAKQALMATAINVDGIVTAKGLVERNGKIVLDGGRSGVTRVSGALDASSANAGQKGGEIRVLGEYVGLFGKAKLDASGASGGGTVLVGGDFQGKNPDAANAKRTFFGPDVVVRADATFNGDGGKVIVWSDDYTRFDGSISARGGPYGGNGGFIETSGKAQLVARGHVDAAAPFGKAGTWLLDPRNVTIVDTDATANTENVGGAFDNGTPNVFTPTADSSTADAQNIRDSLNAGTSVTITTGATGTQDGDITVGVAINKTAGGAATLTLTAADDIFVNQPITSTTGALNMAFTAGNAVNNGGGGLDGIQINAALTSNGGAITLTNSTGAGGGGAVGLNAGAVNVGAGILNLVGNAGNISQSGGSITTTGAGSLRATSTGSVSLPQAANSVTNLGTSSANGFALTNSIPLTVAGAVSGGTGTTSINNVGNLTINAAVSGAAVTLIANGPSNLTVGAAVDSGSGAITLQAVNNVAVNATVGAATSGPITIQADSDSSGAGTLSTIAAIGNAGAGAIDLRGADLTLGALVMSASTLTLQPSTSTSSISVNSAAGTFTVDASDIANLSNGFSSITIGRSDGTGTTTINPITFNDPVVIRQPGAGGAITVNGLITGADNASVTLTAGSGGIVLNNDITTNNQAIALNGAVTLVGANRTLNAGSGAITFASTVNGASNLTVNTTGATTFGGAVGTGPALTSLTTNAGGTTAINGGAVTTTGSQSYNDAVTLGAPIVFSASALTFASTLAAGANAVTLTADEIDFTGGANTVTGTSTILLEPLLAGTSVGVAGGAGTLDISAIDVAPLGDGFSQITIGRSNGAATTP